MIRELPFGFDIFPLRDQLAGHPEAWDQHRWRTNHPRSPHRECSDIWVRYNSLDNLGPNFNDEHEAVWYPVAEDIPAAKSIAQTVSDIRNQALCGVLLTKIPPGKRVHPHADRGWHAENTDKIGVLIHGNPEQKFCFEGVEYGCESGSCFEFCNQYPHWVTNDTDEDRVTLIVCLRRMH